MTLAIRAMRAAKPKGKSETISHLPADISELRSRIAERIEADIALLDALDGDCDLEDGHDAEGHSDDNGIGDYDAIAEQGFPGYGRCA